MLVFILIALTILYFSHYFLFCSIVYFFNLSGVGHRLALGVILFLLPTSFILAEILARRSSNRLFVFFFFCSTLWLGIGLTLLTTFLLAWVAWGGARIFTHSPDPVWFGWAAVALAGLYSGYGVWNAYHPRTTQIRVKIRNLPARVAGQAYRSAFRRASWTHPRCGIPRGPRRQDECPAAGHGGHYRRPFRWR